MSAQDAVAGQEEQGSHDGADVYEQRVPVFLHGMTTQPDITANRHGGNAQSREAFEKIEAALPKMRNTVYAYVKAYSASGGFTCRELGIVLQVGMNQISGRFTELRKDGLIKKQGTRDGCAVWVVTR